MSATTETRALRFRTELPRRITQPSVRLELHTPIGVFLAEVTRAEADRILADLDTGFSKMVHLRDRDKGEEVTVAREHVIAARVVDRG